MLRMVHYTTMIEIKTENQTGKVNGSVVEMRIDMMIAEEIITIGTIETGAMTERGIEEETPIEIEIGMGIETLIEIEMWTEGGIRIEVVVTGGGMIEVGTNRDREEVEVEVAVEDLTHLPLPREG